MEKVLSDSRLIFRIYKELKNNSIEISAVETGEMTQCIRILGALEIDLTSAPKITWQLTAACNVNSMGYDTIFLLLETLSMHKVCMHTCRQYSYT